MDSERTWRREKGTGKTERERDGKSETRIEKEMVKRRLLWGAVGCETGPFTLI